MEIMSLPNPRYLDQSIPWCLVSMSFVQLTDQDTLFVGVAVVSLEMPGNIVVFGKEYDMDLKKSVKLFS